MDTMSEVMDPTHVPNAAPDTDVVAAVQQVLAASDEPLTVPKIRDRLASRHRTDNLEELLQRQAAAKVLHQYPKYRSPQDRYWDRPMPLHVAALIRSATAEEALPWSELRRKLPAYALPHAEAVLQEELTAGRLHRHPRLGRGGERFGVRPPDPKEFLRGELNGMFERLSRLGFTIDRVRAAALEILHDEEWAPRVEALAAATQPPSPAGPSA
jgi:hypothetical protein